MYTWGGAKERPEMKPVNEKILGRLETCALRIGQLDVMADSERRARVTLIDEARAAGVPMHRIAAALGITRQKPLMQGDVCSSCGGEMTVTSVSAAGYDTTCQKCGTDLVLAAL